MNQEEFEAQLADYLGSEMNAEEKAAFEADLVLHPKRASEVDELRATLADLESLQAAAPRPDSTYTAPERSRSVLHRERRIQSWVKAAAILIFGILIGRWSGPPRERLETIDFEPPVVAQVEGVHPGWYELAERLGKNNVLVKGLLRANIGELH